MVEACDSPISRQAIDTVEVIAFATAVQQKTMGERAFSIGRVINRWRFRAIAPNGKRFAMHRNAPQ
jgi:hypothetical protein